MSSLPLCPAWLRRPHRCNIKLDYADCFNWLLPVNSPIVVGGAPLPAKFGDTGANLPSAKSIQLPQPEGLHRCHASRPLTKKRVTLDCQSAADCQSAPHREQASNINLARGSHHL